MNTQNDSKVDSKVIDEQLVQELLTLGQDIGQPLVQDLLAKFKVDFPVYVQTLSVMSLQDSFKEVEHTAHTLKGSASALGALRVRALCEVIEYQAAEKVKTSADQIAEVLSEIRATLPVLETFVTEYTVSTAA